MTLSLFSTPLEKVGLSDLLEMFRKNLLLELNCHAIGTIQEFNKTNQTATVTINYKKVFYKSQSNNSVYTPVLVDYPALIDCPVVFPRGLSCGMTYPVNVGDECLVLFNDRDLNTWFSGDSNNEPGTGRLHSMADGIVIVGLFSSVNALPGFDTERVKLFHGQTVVGAGENLVQIKNAQYTLKELLLELIRDIQQITVTCSAPGSPSSIPMNMAQLQATATKIAGLLE